MPTTSQVLKDNTHLSTEILQQCKIVHNQTEVVLFYDSVCGRVSALRVNRYLSHLLSTGMLLPKKEPSGLLGWFVFDINSPFFAQWRIEQNAHEATALKIVS